MSSKTRKERLNGIAYRKSLNWGMAESLTPQGDGRHSSEKHAATINFTPMSDLDLMIRNGWGNTPQRNLPADWRTRKNLVKGTGYRETRTVGQP